MARLNWFENASFGNRQAAKPGGTAPTLKQIKQLSKDLWKQGRRDAREGTDGLKSEAALALDLIAETALSLGALQNLGRGEEIYRKGGRYWIVVPGSNSPLELSSRLSRRLHRYIKETDDSKADGKRSLFSDSDGYKVSFRLLSRQLNTSLTEEFGEDFKLRDFTAEAAEGSYQPQNPGTPADQPGSESDPVKPARQSSGLQSLSHSASNILPRNIAGLTWIQDTALIGSEEKIFWPGVGTAKITVKDQPGVVTDVAIAVSLSSTQSSTSQKAIYLTLISPDGVRVPIAGTTLEPTYQAYEGTYKPGSVLLSPVGGTRSYLISETRQSKENFELDSTIEAFLNEDNSQAPLSTLSALTGTNGNGEWQLEVTNSQAQSIQLNGWQLFLKTAEKSAETNASGKYSFSELSASSASGPITPWITAPSDRAILSPAGGLNAKTELAHKAADISFGLSSKGAGISSSGSEESAWSRFDLSQLIDQTSLHPQTTLNQAVTALTADAARAKYGVDGEGIKVAVMSVGFNTMGGAEYDVRQGVLPEYLLKDEKKHILYEAKPYEPERYGKYLDQGKGYSYATDDEGRAMLQLVHSIAPGAELYYSNAYEMYGREDLITLIESKQAGFSLDQYSLSAQETMAKRIRELVDAGINVIVDDLWIPNEPFFQDGAISQAIEYASQKGVAYFTIAMNNSNHSYEAAANLSVDTPNDEALTGLTAHNFGTIDNPSYWQEISTVKGSPFTLQWDQPWNNNNSSITLHIKDGEEVITNQRKEGEHPYIMHIPTSNAIEIAITWDQNSAEKPTRFKWVLFDNCSVAKKGINVNVGADDIKKSTAVGHSNPPPGTAATLAAVDYWSTPAYGAEESYVSEFSGWGTTEILFDVDGNRLAQPEIRDRPLISAPQFGDTTFFSGRVGDGSDDPEINYLQNFSGTSAAAPNAAAVAALMLQLNPDLTPVQIFEALKATATPVTAEGSKTTDGFNNASGYGLINAMAALDQIAQFRLSGTVYEDSNGDGRQNAGELGLEGIQVFLDSNGNGRFDANSNWQSFTATASGGDSVSEVTPPTLVKDTLTGLLIDSRYDNVIHGTDKLNSNTPFSESSLLISRITSSSDYDVITEEGKDITLNGDLLLKFEGSSSKTAGSYSILKANSISGSFDNILVKGLDSNLYVGTGIEGGDNIKVNVSETSFVGSTQVGSLY